MMKSKSILLILLMIFTVQVNSQSRKWINKGKKHAIKFELKEGIQRLLIPGTESFLTIKIKGKVPKIISINKTSRGRTYKLKRVNSSNCKMKCSCNNACWKDPYTKEYIGICKTCDADADELSGQIEFLGPDMRE